MTGTTAPAASRIAEVVGAGNVIAEPAELTAYEVDGKRPGAAARPDSAEAVAEILRLAAAERLAVMPMAGRTKLGIGMPPRAYDMALDLSRMNRVLACDPGDLTLGVEPGARFADVQAMLASHRQFLPLAPAYRERATLGGIAAANADSPLRHGYGGVRDFLLGMEFVTGGGVASKSGGRVVKNVTGYDIHKLLVGSLGSLAVVTRLNFRTYPLPPEEATFAATFGDAEGALRFCRAVAQSPLQPRLLDAFDAAAGGMMGARGLPAAGWTVAVSAAGEPAAVERHGREFGRMAREAGAGDFLAFGAEEGRELVDGLSEAPRRWAEAQPRIVIFRTAALATAMPRLVERAGVMAGRHGLAAAVLARAAGVVYTGLWAPEGGKPEALVAACRELMDAGLPAGARPMIERCPWELKREAGVWPPPGEAQKIAERLKKVFDPQGVLAPGRFQGGL